MICAPSIYPAEMPKQSGGTKPLSDGQLVSAYARYMRRHAQLQNALAAARASYPGPHGNHPFEEMPHGTRREQEEKLAALQQRHRNRLREQRGYGKKETPPHLKKWLDHLAKFQAAHPAMTRKEAMVAAKASYKAH